MNASYNLGEWEGIVAWTRERTLWSVEDEVLSATVLRYVVMAVY